MYYKKKERFKQKNLAIKTKTKKCCSPFQKSKIHRVKKEKSNLGFQPCHLLLNCHVLFAWSLSSSVQQNVDSGLSAAVMMK